MSKITKNHIFSVQEAIEFGVNAAIILSNIKIWLEHKIAEGKERHKTIIDGEEVERTWVYYSIKALNEIYPYMGEKQIRNAINRLLEENILIKDTFAFGHYNRTTYYAFRDEDSFIEDCFGERAELFRRKGESLTNINITNSIKDTIETSEDVLDHFKGSNNLEKLHPLMLYWNSLEFTPVHKDPTKKVYKRSVRFLRKLQEGVFGNFLIAEGSDMRDFISKYNLEEVVNKKFSDDEIKVMMDRLNDYMDPSFYPNEDKTALDVLLYNSRGKSTRALWKYVEPSKQGSNMIKCKHPELLDLYLREAFTGKVSASEKKGLVMAVNKMGDEMNVKIREFSEECKAVGTLYTLHARWIKKEVLPSLKDGISPGTIVSCENGFWDNFCEFFESKYHFNLKLSVEEFQESLEEAEVKAKDREAEQRAYIESIEKLKVINREKRNKARAEDKHIFNTRFDSRIDGLSDSEKDRLFGNKETIELFDYNMYGDDFWEDEK